MVLTRLFRALTVVLAVLILAPTSPASATLWDYHVCIYQASMNGAQNQYCDDAWGYNASNSWTYQQARVQAAKDYIHDRYWSVMQIWYDHVNRNQDSRGDVVVWYRVHQCEEPGYYQSNIGSVSPYNDFVSSMDFYQQSTCSADWYMDSNFGGKDRFREYKSDDGTVTFNSFTAPDGSGAINWVSSFIAVVGHIVVPPQQQMAVSAR